MANGEEAREVGHVRWRVYGAYIAAVGPALTITILASLLLMQVGSATPSPAYGSQDDSYCPAQYLQFLSLSDFARRPPEMAATCGCPTGCPMRCLRSFDSLAM